MEKHPHFRFELVPPLQLHKIVEGNPHEYCTVDDFLVHMPSGFAGGYCQEVPREQERIPGGFRVFGYPNINPEMHWRSSSNEHSVMDNPQIQEKIKSFLLSVSTTLGDGVLVQFWAPIRRSSTGQRMLSVAGQPFGLDKLYNGLCRYRYTCIEHEYAVVEDNTSEPVGPIGRAFAEGIPECLPIDCYSIEEFPLRDYAVGSCGIKQYSVMPVFRRDDRYQQQCIGVLEFLALDTLLMRPNGSLPARFQETLQDTNFVIGRGKLHSGLECDLDHARDDVFYEVFDGAREVPKLPLIQLWLPCMCYIPMSIVSKGTTTLFCAFRSSKNLVQVRDKEQFESYCVKNGKSWVERAYSQVKVCFSKNTHQFSVLNYPLVPLTRSYGLTACLAIPLPLIHPYLPPSILEVFLPPQLHYSSGNDENIILWLKELLARLDYEFSKLDNCCCRKPEQEVKFDVCFSHSEDDFVFFDVYRDSKFLNMHKASGKKLGKEKAQEKAENSRPQIDSTNMKYQIPYEEFIQQLGKKRKDAAAALNVSVSTFKRFCKQHGIPRWGKRVDANQIIPWIPSEPVVEGRVEFVPQSDILLVSNNDATEEEPEIELLSNSNATQREAAMGRENSDGSDFMIIKATCKGKTVRFPFSSKSGIKELHIKLAQRFVLEVGKFQIEYDDKEDNQTDWIMVNIDEDLQFQMNTLKSTGQKLMRLKIDQDPII